MFITNIPLNVFHSLVGELFCQGRYGVYRNRQKHKEKRLFWFHTVHVCVCRKQIPLWHDIMRDVRASQMKSWSSLRTYFFFILFLLWHHYSSNQACTHTHAFTLKCRFHDWLSLCRWKLISLFSVPHVSIKFCFLSPFYLEDPPWVSALTPDERHFISELLTQFHRVCLLFEGKIQNNPFQCIFYK